MPGPLIIDLGPPAPPAPPPPPTPRKPWLRAEIVVPALLLFGLVYEYRDWILEGLDLEE